MSETPPIPSTPEAVPGATTPEVESTVEASSEASTDTPAPKKEPATEPVAEVGSKGKGKKDGGKKGEKAEPPTPPTPPTPTTTPPVAVTPPPVIAPPVAEPTLTPEQIAQQEKEKLEREKAEELRKAEEEKKNRPLPPPPKFDQATYEAECLAAQSRSLDDNKVLRAQLQAALNELDPNLTELEKQQKFNEIASEIEANYQARAEKPPVNAAEQALKEKLSARIIALDNAIAQGYLQKAQRGEQLSAEEMKAVLKNFVENGRNSALDALYLKGMNFNSWKDALDHYGVKDQVAAGGVQIDANGNKIVVGGSKPENQEGVGLIQRIRNATPKWLRRSAGESVRGGAIMAGTAGIVALVTGGAIAWPALIGGAVAATATSLYGRWKQDKALSGKKANGQSLGDAAMANLIQHAFASQQNARAILENKDLKQENLAQQFNLLVKQLRDKSVIEYGKKGAAPDEDPIQKFERTRQKFDKAINLARMVATLAGGALGSGYYAAQQLAMAKAQGVDMANNQLAHGLHSYTQHLAHAKDTVIGHHIMFNQADNAWHAVLTPQDIAAAKVNLGGHFTPHLLNQYWHMATPSGAHAAIDVSALNTISTGTGQVLHSASVADPTWQVLREAFSFGMQNTAVATGLEGIWGAASALRDSGGRNAARLAAANAFSGLYQDNLPPADPLAGLDGKTPPNGPSDSKGGSPSPDRKRSEIMADEGFGRAVDKNLSSFDDIPAEKQKERLDNLKERLKNFEHDIKGFPETQNAFGNLKKLIKKEWRDNKSPKNTVIYSTEENAKHLGSILKTDEGEKRVVIAVDSEKLASEATREAYISGLNLPEGVEVTLVPANARWSEWKDGKRVTYEGIYWPIIMDRIGTIRNIEADRAVRFMEAEPDADLKKAKLFGEDPNIVPKDDKEEEEKKKKGSEIVEEDDPEDVKGLTKAEKERLGKLIAQEAVETVLEKHPLSKKSPEEEVGDAKLRAALRSNFYEFVTSENMWSEVGHAPHTKEGLAPKTVEEIAALIEEGKWRDLIHTKEEKNKKVTVDGLKAVERLEYLAQYALFVADRKRTLNVGDIDALPENSLVNIEVWRDSAAEKDNNERNLPGMPGYNLSKVIEFHRERNLYILDQKVAYQAAAEQLSTLASRLREEIGNAENKSGISNRIELILDALPSHQALREAARVEFYTGSTKWLRGVIKIDGYPVQYHALYKRVESLKDSLQELRNGSSLSRLQNAFDAHTAVVDELKRLNLPETETLLSSLQADDLEAIKWVVADRSRGLTDADTAESTLESPEDLEKLQEFLKELDLQPVFGENLALSPEQRELIYAAAKSVEGLLLTAYLEEPLWKQLRDKTLELQQGGIDFENISNKDGGKDADLSVEIKDGKAEITVSSKVYQLDRHWDHLVNVIAYSATPDADLKDRPTSDLKESLTPIYAYLKHVQDERAAKMNEVKVNPNQYDEPVGPPTPPEPPVEPPTQPEPPEPPVVPPVEPPAPTLPPVETPPPASTAQVTEQFTDADPLDAQVSDSMTDEEIIAQYKKGVSGRSVVPKALTQSGPLSLSEIRKVISTKKEKTDQVKLDKTSVLRRMRLMARALEEAFNDKRLNLDVAVIDTAEALRKSAERLEKATLAADAPQSSDVHESQ